MSISLQYSPFASSLPLFPCFHCPVPQPFILESRYFVWSRLQYTEHIPPPLPFAHAHALRPLTLVWSSRLLRLPFPIMLPHRSLASAFPTHSPHACRSGQLPPSFLSPLELPILSPCPSPGWISPRCLSSLFLRRSYIFWCIFWCLYYPSPYQSVCTKMYGHFWERIHYPLQLPSSTVVGVGVNSCVPSEGEYTLSCDAW